MKSLDVCGVGNALVDILVRLSEQSFVSLGFERGSTRLVEESEQRETLAKLAGQEISKQRTWASGGSVGNSIIAVGQLGGKAALCCHVAHDDVGLFYRKELQEIGIECNGEIEPGGVSGTGTCLTLVTPDAERTMRTFLGATLRLNERDISEDIIKRSKWLFIEGFVIANGDDGQRAVLRAIEYAKKHGTKIAFSCSEPFVIDVFSKVVDEVVRQSDLVFCNEQEAKALAKASDGRVAFQELVKRIPGVIVTLGAEGALVRYDGKEYRFDAIPCRPVDLTGAGDMFAGAVLYGICHGHPLEKIGRAAAQLSTKVITQIGARLANGTKEVWNAA